MTNEEIEALSQEAQKLIGKKAKDYEEAVKNTERIKEIHHIIHDETLRRVAESYRKDGIDPYKPCPTCGHIPIRKP